jgi:hypothetical protein
MPAQFHFDQSPTKDCKNPGQAIAWLQQSAYGSLSACYTGRPPSGITLESTALLMMGTTDDLQKVLRQDYNDGIQALWTTGMGSMKIWYVRRRAGKETKTVVIIASWPDYWDSRNDYYYSAQNKKGWYDLYQNSYIEAISLQILANQILPNAKGVDAWW